MPLFWRSLVDGLGLVYLLRVSTGYGVGYAYEFDYTVSFFS